MRNTKRAVAAAVEILPALIEETVDLDRQIERLVTRARANRDAIKATLLEHKITRQPTANGFEALLIEKLCLSWNVAALDGVRKSGLLTLEQFETLCPRKPDGEKLRALLDSCSDKPAKELRACAKGSKRVDLELRAPAANTKGEKGSAAAA